VRDSIGVNNARAADLNFLPSLVTNNPDAVLLMANSLLWVSRKCECPGDIVVDNDTGLCGAEVDYYVPSPLGAVVTQIDESGFYSGDVFPVGTTLQQWEFDYGEGVIDTCSFTVTVNDTTPPYLSLPADTTFEACGTEALEDLTELAFSTSEVVITLQQLQDAGGDASDNCEIKEIKYRDAISEGSCPDTITRTFTITDTCENQTSKNQTIMIKDIIDPVITGTLEADTIYMDENCETVLPDTALTVTELVGMNGITDVTDCNLVEEIEVEDNINLESVEDPCYESYIRVYTVMDSCGNSATADQLIYLTDTILPTIDCSVGYTFYLKEDGEYVLNFSDIDAVRANTSDNCTPQDDIEVSMFPRSFECIHVGEDVPVTITATDGCNNSASCTAMVTIIDTIPPVMLCEDIEVALDENGKARIYPAWINAGTSHTSIPAWARTYNDMESGCYDACGIELLELSRYEFTCEDIGTNTVTMTAFDPSGNSSECEVTVTVVDGAMPWVECTDTSLVLDENGMAQLTMEMVVADYGDQCGVDTVIVDPMDFDCEMTGENEVTVTVIDKGGNHAVCTAMVTVHDNQVPVIEQQEDLEITVVPGICLTPVGEYPDIIVTDNCDIELTLDEGYGPSGMFPLGTSVETWTATDNAGNSVTMSFNITISTYNGAPAIDAVDDIIMVRDSGVMVLTLTGITPGMDCEEQTVTEVTVSCSDTMIVKTMLEYEAGADTAVLHLNPADFGQAEITVTVMDDGGTENGGTDVTQITFNVDVVEEMPVYSQFDLADMRVKLYPNPTSDMVYIDINRNVMSPVDLSVYTISGKQIIRRIFNDSQYISFSMKDHVSGMYFVKMNIEGQRVVKKLVLDRR